MFGFAEMGGGVADRGKGLALKCVFEYLRWKSKLGRGFQLRGVRICLMVYVDRLQRIQTVTYVLLADLELVGSPDRLQARALLVASGDFGTRKMAVTRPSIERRLHHHAAEHAGDAVRRLQRE